MFASDGFAFDFAILECCLVKNQLFDMIVISQEVFYNFWEYQGFYFFILFLLLRPLEVDLYSFDQHNGRI